MPVSFKRQWNQPFASCPPPDCSKVYIFTFLLLKNILAEPRTFSLSCGLPHLYGLPFFLHKTFVYVASERDLTHGNNPNSYTYSFVQWYLGSDQDEGLNE